MKTRIFPLSVLIVEDTLDNLRQLKELLTDQFPNIIVDGATDVENGMGFLIQKGMSRDPYHCLILDLKLPQKPGAIPDPDTTLPLKSLECLEAQRFGPDATTVIQWTAYPEDDALKAVVESVRKSSFSDQYQILGKGDMDTPFKILRILDEIAAEEALGKMFDLHRPYFDSLREAPRSPRSSMPARPPFYLPGFVAALEEAWHLLRPDRQKDALELLRGTAWELEEIDDNGEKIVQPRHQAARSDLEELRGLEEG